MRPLALAVSILVAQPASAHVGHLADLAGHDHWIAGAAVGAAILAGLWGALKGPKEAEPAEAEPDQAEEEAEA